MSFPDISPAWLIAIVIMAGAGACAASLVAYRRKLRPLWSCYETLRSEHTSTVRRLTADLQFLTGQLCAVRQGLSTPPRFVAQDGEDLVAWRFFGGLRCGVFVEIGAYDGLSFSNTLALEDIGWSGLLVEANPSKAAQCVLNRPKVRVINAAIGGPSAEGSVPFVVARNRLTGCEMLSAVDPSPAHRRRCQREGCDVREESVPFRSLASVLDEAGSEAIDLLSIDIEGAELAALQGADLNRFRPRLIVVEEAGPGSEVGCYLREQGYAHVCRCGGNDFYSR